MSEIIVHLQNMVIDLQRKLEEKDRELNYLKSQIKILTNVNNQNIND
jgi:hypothetical protein